MACDQVLIFDTSSLMDTKSRITVRHQWWFFDALLARLRQGRVVVPLQTMRELLVEHPDMPGAWAAGTYQESPHPHNADYEWVQEVMSSSARDVIDIDAEMDEADPWVLALALQLQSGGFEVVVVTGDVRDRPSRISLVSACSVFGIPHMDLSEALDWLDDHPVELGPLPAFA